MLNDDEDKYGVGQACLNGHPVTGAVDHFPGNAEAYCSECGAQTITVCPRCSQPIKGMYLGGLFGHWSPAAFCHACGAPFPWTEAGLAAAREVTTLLSGLSEAERTALSASFDDLIRDTPRTGVAALRVKVALSKVGREGGAALREILVSIATDAAKRQMGL